MGQVCKWEQLYALCSNFHHEIDPSKVIIGNPASYQGRVRCQKGLAVMLKCAQDKIFWGTHNTLEFTLYEMWKSRTLMLTTKESPVLLPQPRGASQSAHQKPGAGEALCWQVWGSRREIQGHLLFRPVTGTWHPLHHTLSSFLYIFGVTVFHFVCWCMTHVVQLSLQFPPTYPCKPWTLTLGLSDPVLHHLHHCPGQQLPGYGGPAHEHQDSVLAAGHHHQHQRHHDCHRVWCCPDCVPGEARIKCYIIILKIYFTKFWNILKEVWGN